MNLKPNRHHLAAVLVWISLMTASAQPQTDRATPHLYKDGTAKQLIADGRPFPARMVANLL